MPPAGVLLAALRHLPTAAHFQGNHGEVGGFSVVTPLGWGLCVLTAWAGCCLLLYLHPLLVSILLLCA